MRALLFLALCSPLAAFSAAPQDAFELNLLVYNTHGLPSIIAGDRPTERFPKIAQLTKNYELALLQEDFAHHHILHRNLPKSHYASRGENPGTRKCLVCSNSGLTTISAFASNEWKMSTTFTPFNKCSGWLGKLNDCFAQKGFQIGTLESPAGHRIIFVNTHLDAGRSAHDRVARASQLEQIASAMQATAQGEAIILAGDLNLDWQSPEDKALLLHFRDRLKLTRAGQGLQAKRGWRVLDYIYFRSGSSTTLTVLDSGEDLSFTADSEPLSDHPALFAKFSVQ